MSGHILIVDDLSLNRMVLRAKLTAACYQTLTASGGKTALDLAQDQVPDLILLDYHMPDMDGLAVCEALRANPKTQDIPIILFSATNDQAHRLGALSAGADDFLAKPLDETYLLGRIRSLLRGAAKRDEWRDHPNTALRAGMADLAATFQAPPRITVLAGKTAAGPDWQASLASIWPDARSETLTMPDALALPSPRRAPDLFLVTPGALDQSGLPIIAELRSRAATRHSEICLILPETAKAQGAMALDLGAADILYLPIESAEARLRLEKIIARKHQSDAQRRALESQLGLAAFDPLTGLHNRSHALTRLSHATQNATGQFALLMIDLDRFKNVNDQYGHNAGDEILRQVSRRMREGLRHSDILCRYGGEEFLLAMPDADLAAARLVAERLSARIASRPFDVPGLAVPLRITASVGISVHVTDSGPLTADRLQTLIEDSDKALHHAKRSGRNQVVSALPVSA